MNEITFALCFLYVPAFALIFFLSWKRYRTAESVTGAVLLRLRPTGLRLALLLSALAFFLAAAVSAFVIWGRFRPDAITMLQQGALVAQGLIAFMCGMLPMKICENGLVDESGFLPWDAVERCEEKRPGRFLLRLKDDRTGRLFRRRTLGLSCPPGDEEELGAVLRARVG